MGCLRAAASLLLGRWRKTLCVSDCAMQVPAAGGLGRMEVETGRICQAECESAVVVMRLAGLACGAC